jgi:nitrogen regulatory protein P-II 1
LHAGNLKESEVMKLIKAYIRQRKMEEVYKILKKAGFCCMTMVECEGTGQYSDHEKEHISDKYPYADAYRVIKLEILVSDEHVRGVVELIRKGGRTGYRGDGMIIISPVEEVYKVRTDETGILSV